MQEQVQSKESLPRPLVKVWKIFSKYVKAGAAALCKYQFIGGDIQRQVRSEYEY